MRTYRILALLLLLGAAAPPAALAVEYQGIQPSGARYRIVVPDTGWNGDLVAYAHGFVFPLPGVPLDFHDTLPDGTDIADVATSLGYAYAVTSYRQNGLVVLEGVEDVLELVRVVFPGVAGATPDRVYLVGASNGGIVTTLSIERHAWAYSGGVAVCGPVGSFRGQIDYFGSARVLFDYFFPGVIPGSPIAIPAEVMAGWASVYAPQVIDAVFANPSRAAEAARVAGLAFDPQNPVTIADAWVSVLAYNIYATNDAIAKLGGNPFDNARRIYLGSSNDFRLNLRIQRFSAEPAARAALGAYETSGRLAAPLVTAHTTQDPIIPYWHELLYGAKTLLSGSWVQHVNIPVARYGHCAFTRDELLFAFALVVFRVEGLPGF